MKQLKTLPEPIIYTASRLEAISNRFVFEPLKISLSSVKILCVLEQRGPLTLKEILNFSGGTKSNASQRLTVLEKNGYVKRNRAKVQDDKRKVVIEITKKGLEKLALIDKRLKKANLHLIKNFSKKEQELFFEFFERINKIINREENNLKEIFKQ